MATGALTEEVAANLEEAAEVTRQLDTRSVGFFLGGVCVGVAVGFYFGYRFNKEKLRAEAFAQSEKEVEQIREVYQQKTIAAEPKPSVEDVIEERGYVSAEDEAKLDEVQERPLPAPVPVDEPRPVPRVVRTEDGEKDKHDGWSYPAEMQRRTSTRPYIIHQDEFATNETEYSQSSLTYYEGDNILADEDDTVVNNLDDLIGEDNLKRFGHGTDDLNLLYVRNPVIEAEYEIARNPGSYEQEVMGLEHSDDYRRRHPNRPDHDETN